MFLQRTTSFWHISDLLQLWDFTSESLCKFVGGPGFMYIPQVLDRCWLFSLFSFAAESPSWVQMSEINHLIWGKVEVFSIHSGTAKHTLSIMRPTAKMTLSWLLLKIILVTVGKKLKLSYLIVRCLSKEHLGCPYFHQTWRCLTEKQVLSQLLFNDLFDS